jgi:hypothetical protein
MEIDYHICDNCKATVSNDNWLIHNSICHKHNYWCNYCNISVAKYSKTEHDKLHDYILCSCGETIQNLKFQEHLKTDCTKRIIECQYCNMEILYSNKDEHEEMCGTRTDICQDCDKRIMIKKMSNHQCVLKCPICNIKIDDESDLQVHYVSEHLD